MASGPNLARQDACHRGLCPSRIQDDDIVDMFKLAKSGTIVSAVVHAWSAALRKALVTADHGEPMGPNVEEFGVIWLKGVRAKALQSEPELAYEWKDKGALGLALRPSGLGIRAKKQFSDAAHGCHPTHTRYLLSAV